MTVEFKDARSMMTALEAYETRKAFSSRRNDLLKYWLMSYENTLNDYRADDLAFWAQCMSSCNKAQESLGFSNNYVPPSEVK